MLIRVRRTRTHPAADWTSANPWLEPLEMGIEEELPNKAKINFSDVRVRWNSLDYWNPSGVTGGDSGGVQIATTTVQTNVGTKQALLAAVPTGKVRIVTQVVARNASASLGAIADGISFGMNAGASNWGNISNSLLSEMTTSTQYISQDSANVVDGSGFPQTVGGAGDIFGCIFNDPSIPATLDIDTFYYDVDA